MRVLFLFLLSASVLFGQNSRLFYLGGPGFDDLHDAVQLSDGNILVVGATDQLDWLPHGTEVIELDGSDISNNQGSDRFAFLMVLEPSLDRILHFVHLGKGQAENIRFIKTTNLPRFRTGDMYISGTTEDSEEGGYFIARLDNNFVDGLPSSLEWVVNVKCTSGGYPKTYQPWDVDSDGRVYYVRGDSHAYNWSAMYRLGQDGEREVVEHWRTHWKKEGGEYRATPASDYPGGIDALMESGIVFKRDGRCNMRSWTDAEYEAIFPDGNGGWKQGTWPMDVLFSGPCDPEDNPSTSGPGYTGYRPPGTFTYGPSIVTVDRLTNEVYLGINMKSVLPGGQPDFEPAVVKFDPEGQLLGWSRLYHEVRPDSSEWNSTPDQYVDGIAIDYTNNEVIINARCHGNNVENFWEGNTVDLRPGANSFQNQFTGSSGNIHISWLGRFDEDFTLVASTYVAEMANGGSGRGGPMTDPLMDGWPSPNSGWPELNTTRLVPNTLKVTSDGSVVIIGQGRRTMTTANAYQKMPKPGKGGTSRWNHFVRQYDRYFKRPFYSSLVAGTWDTLNTQPGLEARLRAVFKMTDGLLVVGQHNGQGNTLPVMGVPRWGKDTYEDEEAFIGILKDDLITNPQDDPVVTTTSNVDDDMGLVVLRPNPTTDWITWTTQPMAQEVMVIDVNGQTLMRSKDRTIDLGGLSKGMYILRFLGPEGVIATKSIIRF